MSDFNAHIVAEFREKGGKADAFGDTPLIIMHTIGSKTGQTREIPLVAHLDGERIVIFASAAGAPNHPQWFHNLLAHPDVEIEFGTETFPVTATVLTGAEREHYFQSQKELAPIFGEYEKNASPREIPVIALDPLTAPR